MAPLVDRHKVLKDKLEARLKDTPGDKPVTLRGTQYELQYGTRRNERTITNKRKLFALLKERLGLAGVLALVDIPLAAVDKHVTTTEQKALVVEERTGWRKLDVVALSAPQKVPPVDAA